MMTVTPDYYPDFACLLGACRHTCCAGWEIDVDGDTLDCFHSLPGAFGEHVRSQLTEGPEGTCIRLTEEGRCPFLQPDGLCELMLTLGEDCVSDICADHPRFRSWFSDRTEVGLGLCCEAAAQLILSRKEPVRFLIEEDGEPTEENTEFEQELLAFRDNAIHIAQDRTLPVLARVEALERLAGASAPADPAALTEFLLTLEVMDPAWTALLQRYLAEPVPAVEAPETELPREQLLVYLLWRHLPEAEDGTDLPPLLRFCTESFRLLCRLEASEQLRDQENMGFDELCRLWSAEIEYSDENPQKIMEWLG